MSEPVLYSDALVTVTPSLIVAGQDSYPISNLTSVKVSKVPPSAAPGMISMVLSAVVCAYASQQEGMVVLGMVGVGLALAVIAVVAFATAKPTFFVQLVTASGEVRSLGAVDRERNDGRYKAIHRAIAERNSKPAISLHV